MAEYNPSKIIKDGNTYNFRDGTKIPLAGSNAISGSLIPATDNSIDIGSSTKNIKTLYTKGITIDGKIVDTDANGNLVYDGHIVDTIEEQGDGYIRYSNGIQICWGTASATTSVSAVGNVYINENTGIAVTFPVAFASAPVISVVQKGSELSWNFAVIATQCTATGITRVGIMRGWSMTDQEVTMDYIAIGRWK